MEIEQIQTVTVDEFESYAQSLADNDSTNPYWVRVTGVTAANLNEKVLYKMNGRYFNFFETEIPELESQNSIFWNNYVVVTPKTNIVMEESYFNNCFNICLKRFDTLPSVTTCLINNSYNNLKKIYVANDSNRIQLIDWLIENKDDVWLGGSWSEGSVRENVKVYDPKMNVILS